MMLDDIIYIYILAISLIWVHIQKAPLNANVGVSRGARGLHFGLSLPLYPNLAYTQSQRLWRAYASPQACLSFCCSPMGYVSNSYALAQ